MAARAPGAPAGMAPAWVTAALGPGLADVARLPWGFSNETWGATTPDGERYAVTRMASREACAFVLHEGPAIARRIVAAGLEVPVPITERSSASAGIVVSAWLDGTPAMQRLSGVDGAAAVGRAVGDAWRRLGVVDTDGLRLDETFASADRLGSAASRWLSSVSGSLSPRGVVGVNRSIVAVAADEPRRSFVHGDLVPANVLLRDSGPALLDLEAARVSDPLFDAAWFRWIVAYHHPELLRPAWSAFAGAAGLVSDDAGLTARLDAYPVLRILEILAGSALTPAARDRWLGQLEAAVAGAAAA